MSVALINNCVILPHAPDWRHGVRHKRRWDTKVTGGIDASEDRATGRQGPLRTLEYTVLAVSRQDRARLSYRLLAALKKGRAVAPLWGRGCELLSAAGTASDPGRTYVNIGGLWPWREGDYAFFTTKELGIDDNWEIKPVIFGSNERQLRWSGTLTGNYPAGASVHPLLFGTPSAGKMQAITGWYGQVELTLREPLGSGALGVPGLCPSEICGTSGGTIIVLWGGVGFSPGLTGQQNYFANWTKPAGATRYLSLNIGAEINPNDYLPPDWLYTWVTEAQAKFDAEAYDVYQQQFYWYWADNALHWSADPYLGVGAWIDFPGRGWQLAIAYNLNP